MDDRRFDELTKILTTNPSRRSVFAGLAGSLLGAVASQLGDGAAAASKKKSKKKKKKKKNKSGSSPDQGSAPICPGPDFVAYCKENNREGCAHWFPSAGQAECIAYHDGCCDMLAGCQENTYSLQNCEFTFCDSTGPMAKAAGDPMPAVNDCGIQYAATRL
jgi:hypothetical protein